MKYENKLNYTKPLDVLFSNLESLLKFPDKSEDRIDVVYNNIKNNPDEFSQPSITSLEETHNENEKDEQLDRLTFVTNFYLEQIRAIQNLTIAEKEKANDPSLIMISLYDLKTFNLLVSLLVADVIHTILPINVGVPIDIRTNLKIYSRENYGKSRDRNIVLSKKVAACLVEFLGKKGDVRDLLLLGPFTVDYLTISGRLAFDSVTTSKDTVGWYNQIVKQIDTYQLYLHLTTLIRKNTPKWFVAGISSTLALLPTTRPDGIKCLIEFISGSRESEEVKISDLDKAVKILKSVPRNMPIEVYTSRVMKQFIGILGSMTSSIGVPTIQIITMLYSERKEIITLGIKNIVQARFNPPAPKNQKSVEEDIVLVTEKELDETLRFLDLIIIKSHSVDLITEFMDPIFLLLWTLICYLIDAKKVSDLPISVLVNTIQSMTEKSDILLEIISQNLMAGNYAKTWKYGPSDTGGVEIRSSNNNEVGDLIDSFESGLALDVDNTAKMFEKIEGRVEKFLVILEMLEDDIVSRYFVKLLQEWMDHGSKATENEINPFRMLVEMKVLEAVIDKCKKKLLGNVDDILGVVKGALQNYVDKLDSKSGSQQNNNKTKTLEEFVTLDGDSDDEDEEPLGASVNDSDDEEDDDKIANDEEDSQAVIKLCISLISAILMELDSSPDSDKSSSISVLLSLRPLLARLPSSIAAPTLTKLEILAPDGKIPEVPTKSSSQSQFLKAIQLFEDPSPPVSAHGMHLLKNLIDKKDSSINPHLATRMFISKLQDKDSYIYLNAIKALEALFQKNGFDVIDILLAKYVDTNQGMDTRIRIAEVLEKWIRVTGPVMNPLHGKKVIGHIYQTISSMMDSNASKSQDDPDIPNKHEQHEILQLSALSLLASLHETVPLLVLEFLPDSIYFATSILSTGNTLIRRGAVNVVVCIIRGLDKVSGIQTGTEGFSIIISNGSGAADGTKVQFGEIKKWLEILQNDKDPILKEQSRVALKSVDEFVLGL